MDSNQHCSFGPTKKSARPSTLARALPVPRPQPGPRPAKPRGRVRPPGPAIGPVVSTEQNTGRRRSPNPNLILHSLPLSSLSQRRVDTERERAITAEPWRRRRPPRWRARSPAGECAAVERPGHGALCQRPRSSHTGGCRALAAVVASSRALTRRQRGARRTRALPRPLFFL